jgi:hypothetical protein
MSWEVMGSQTTECHCGKGTMTHVMEMDDWNRTRSSTEIHCPDCSEKAAREAEERRQEEARNDALYSKAKRLATDRYLRKWLDLYSGLTAKAAWQRYTGGSGYPALGTFYKHVKHAGGVAEYMRRCFVTDIEDALRKMSIEDKEIDELLSQRSKAPPTPLRHPYD